MATVTADLIEKAKLARRITTDAFDDQIESLLNSWMTDMGIAGVEIPEAMTPILETAAFTYVGMHFGDPDDYDRLKKSYDEQKAQLSMYTGYTAWEDE